MNKETIEKLEFIRKLNEEYKRKMQRRRKEKSFEIKNPDDISCFGVLDEGEDWDVLFDDDLEVIKMKLYNMEKGEWEGGKFKRGDHWRSDRVYECNICKCKSNEYVMGGWPSMGPRLVCPGLEENPELHDELQEKVWNLEDEGKKHPKAYLKMLREEIEEIRKDFSHVKPNVRGIEFRERK